MTISDSYREQNRELHSLKPSYGASADAVPYVKKVIKEYRPKDILDYGCGKAMLSKSLGWFSPKVYNYDPAIKEYENGRKEADMVVCTDVLEHIEPEMLDGVLDDLKKYTRKVLLLSVATRPAHKNLPDGRNAHLIVEQIEWWMPKIRERFDVVRFWGDKSEFYLLVEAKA